MIIIGEKLNGSIPACGAAIAARDEEYIRQMARRQAQAGAEYLDCCASVQENELQTLQWMAELAEEETGLPLCLDSPDPQVCAQAIRFCKREGIVNSVSLEGDKAEVIFPAIAGTGWGCVALLSGNGLIPKNAEDRLENLEKLMAKAKAYGVEPERLYIDPLVEGLATSGESLLTFAKTAREIRRRYPLVHITSGLSNISFGLPKRKLINMAFVVLAMEAGMDSAILDPTNKDLIGVVYAAQALLGNDEYCMEYIGAYREGLFGPIS